MPERYAEPVDGVLAAGLDDTVRHQLLLLLLRQQHRHTGPDHVRCRPGRVARAHRLPQLGVGDVVVDRIDVVGKAQRVPLGVVERDVQVLGVHQLADHAVHALVELLLVEGGSRHLGDPMERHLRPLVSDALGVVAVDRVEARVLTVDVQRHHRDLDVDERAVLASSARDAVDAPRGQRLVGLDRRIGREVVRGEHELFDRAADRLVGRPAEQQGCGRVPAGHDLLAIHRHDRDRADLDERLEVLLLAADGFVSSRELLLRLLLLGDVDHAALLVLGLPVLVVHCPRLVAHPHRSSVGGDHAVLAHPDAVVLLRREVVLGQHPLAVVRVQHAAEEVGLGPCLERVPEHRHRPRAHVLRGVRVADRGPVHGDRDRIEELAVAALGLLHLRQRPRELGARELLLRDVHHEALEPLGLAVRVPQDPLLVANVDRATVGGDQPVLTDIGVVALLERARCLFANAGFVVRMEDGEVERVLQPALDGVPEHALDHRADVLRCRRVGPVEVHRPGQVLDEPPVPVLGLLLRLERRSAREVALDLVRDVDEESLDVFGLAGVTRDHGRVVAHPDHMAVGGHDAIAERPAVPLVGKGGRVLVEDPYAVVGVDHALEEVVLVPALGGVAEYRLDLRADVEGRGLRVRPVEVHRERQRLDDATESLQVLGIERLRPGQPQVRRDLVALRHIVSRRLPSAAASCSATVHRRVGSVRPRSVTSST